jgi:cell wall-associated NlpC family hydrolase
MSDPRSTPDPDLVTQDNKARVVWPVADLNRHAGDAPRDRQILFGEQVTVLGQDGADSYVIAQKDGYVGFVKTAALGPDIAITHRINAAATHVYSAANMKSADLFTLHHGSLITVTNMDEKFGQTAHGFVPIQHIKPDDEPEQNLIEIAKIYLGTPYLWGGNSRAGIDCSGLVQAALTACAIPCPGDSDQQQDQLGTHLPAESNVKKGDLFFWKGHVALAADSTTLIHANAHHMSVAYEPIADAIARIQAQGDGPVTARKRLSLYR